MLGQRRIWRAAILFGVAAAMAAVIVVSALTIRYEDLGYGSTGNNVMTLAVLVGTVCSTVGWVSWTRAKTHKGSVTPWRRVGAFWLAAVGAWLVVTFVVVGSERLGPVPVLSVLGAVVPLFILPSVFGFPVWLVVSAIRGRRKAAVVVPVVQLEVQASVPVAAPDGAYGDTSVETVPTPVAHPIDSAEQPLPTAVAAEAVAPTEADEASLAHSSRRGIPRALMLTCVAVVAVGALLALVWIGDQWTRAQELSAVTTQMETSEKAMKDLFPIEDKAIETRDRYKNASETQLNAAQMDMEEQLRQANAATAVQLRIIDHDLRNTPVMAWHGDIAQYRSDYLEHMRSWLDRFEGYAQAKDGNVMTEVARKAGIDIEASWAIVQRSSADAVPTLFADATAQRIKAVFGD